MNPSILRAVVVCCLALACDASDDKAAGHERACRDGLVQRRDHIMAVLVSNVQAGVLVESAVPCGPEGVASRPDSFASTASQGDVERLTAEFEQLCSDYAVSEGCPDAG
jgi:hypothetical protein